MQDDVSGWNNWFTTFSQIDEISGASELHGFITGVLCTTDLPDKNEWLKILALLDIQELSEQTLDLLMEEAEDVKNALDDADLDYFPLLPDDGHDLAERVEALANWCRGVVLGFGLTCGSLTADEQELIENLQDIASVNFADDDNDEDGENSYYELYEFVRLIPISLSMGRKPRINHDVVLDDDKPQRLS